MYKKDTKLLMPSIAGDTGISTVSGGATNFGQSKVSPPKAAMDLLEAAIKSGSYTARMKFADNSTLSWSTIFFRLQNKYFFSRCNFSLHHGSWLPSKRYPRASILLLKTILLDGSPGMSHGVARSNERKYSSIKVLFVYLCEGKTKTYCVVDASSLSESSRGYILVRNTVMAAYSALSC